MVQGASRGIGLEFVRKILTHTFAQFYRVGFFVFPFMVSFELLGGCVIGALFNFYGFMMLFSDTHLWN